MFESIIAKAACKWKMIEEHLTRIYEKYRWTSRGDKLKWKINNDKNSREPLQIDLRNKLFFLLKIDKYFSSTWQFLFYWVPWPPLLDKHVYIHPSSSGLCVGEAKEERRQSVGSLSFWIRFNGRSVVGRRTAMKENIPPPQQKKTT